MPVRVHVSRKLPLGPAWEDTSSIPGFGKEPSWEAQSCHVLMQTPQGLGGSRMSRGEAPQLAWTGLQTALATPPSHPPRQPAPQTLRLLGVLQCENSEI